MSKSSLKKSMWGWTVRWVVLLWLRCFPRCCDWWLAGRRRSFASAYEAAVNRLLRTPLAHGVAHLPALPRHRKYPAHCTASSASPTMHHGTETLGCDGPRWSWDELALGCGTSYQLIRGRLELGRLSTGTRYLGRVVLDPSGVVRTKLLDDAARKFVRKPLLIELGLFKWRW